MEHLSLSEITIDLKDLATVIFQLGDKFITEANQSINSIYIGGYSDRDSPFGIRKSGNKMNVGSGWNVDDKTSINPLRSIGSPHP